MRSRCIMGASELNAGSNPVMDQHPIQGGEKILSVTTFYRNRDKLWSDHWATWFK